MLDLNENNLFSEKTIDNLPQHIAQGKIDRVKKSQTEGIAGTLRIKLNSIVMLTVNADLQDRLVKQIVLNSQIMSENFIQSLMIVKQT